MIRLLIICLFLFSCSSEVEYQSFPEDSDLISRQRLETIEFNPEIEMMLIFLWPKDLNYEDEDAVVAIISRSREITAKKEQYLKNLAKLADSYQLNNCDCHIFGFCDDNIEMDDDTLVVCEEISVRQDENGLVLASLTQDHEFIKEQLNSIGAINIDVGLDEDFLNIGSYQRESRSINLNKFVYNNKNESVSFELSSYRNRGLNATFEFTVGNETFFGDVGVSDKQYNVFFSGDIETSSGYRGLIYWEHLK